MTSNEKAIADLEAFLREYRGGYEGQHTRQTIKGLLYKINSLNDSYIQEKKGVILEFSEILFSNGKQDRYRNGASSVLNSILKALSSLKTRNSYLEKYNVAQKLVKNLDTQKDTDFPRRIMHFKSNSLYSEDEISILSELTTPEKGTNQIGEVETIGFTINLDQWRYIQELTEN
jgi:hypothetical protein